MATPESHGIDEQAVEDPELEYRLCLAAVPGMMLVALGFHFLLPGMQRIVFGMPVHELGHAVSAWFTGFWAIPTLWKTVVFEERSILVPLVLAAAMGFVMFRAWHAEKWLLMGLAGAAIALALFGRFGVRESTAETLIVFGGDGLGMVIATLLMASFFFGKDTQLYQGSLRWGFLAIGAAAFVDMFGTWWVAHNDYGRIPYGEHEGGLLSDSSRLLGEFGWSADQIAGRYFTLGMTCLVALVAVYAWGVRAAWKKARGV